VPGGPVGLPSRWAATSNVEVGKTTYPVNRGRIGREGKEWSNMYGKERKGGSGMEEGPKTLSSKGRALIGYLCRDPQSS